MGRLESISEQALKEKNFDVIENLVSITKDVFDVDRDTMYYYLLRSYSEWNMIIMSVDFVRSYGCLQISLTTLEMELSFAFCYMHIYIFGRNNRRLNLLNIL